MPTAVASIRHEHVEAIIPELPTPVLSDHQVRGLLATCSDKDFRGRRDTAIKCTCCVIYQIRSCSSSWRHYLVTLYGQSHSSTDIYASSQPIARLPPRPSDGP